MVKLVSPILLLTFGLGLLNLQESSQRMTRTTALRSLRGCATRPITLGCSEATAEYLVKLYQKGDKSLLKPLLDAGLTSDGALSETLGDFYSNVLWRNPREFVGALTSHRKEEQHSLCRLAATTDGSGMENDMLRDVRRKLRRMRSQRGRLASVARICLLEVDKANATSK